MILRNVLALRNSINEYHKKMYELAREKGISDPDVVKISQQLDHKIMMLQKIMYGTQSVLKVGFH
ncbi:aspartyl-phosphate phosphatase Spo0E family protein [Ectobacillus funiculus]|uniref:aspartyl-phosphate phosphatase Spo0E family protein n=1 Tax=Ectobacillus funiculus TaxID=137993 RepID=UPI00397CB77D